LETTNIHIHDHLVSSAANGNRKAQTELYGLYARAMLNVSYRMVRDASIAEDLMQDAFIDAFQKLEQFNFDSTFGSWLKKIVINKSLNHLRREKMIQEKEQNIIEIANWHEDAIEDQWSERFSIEDIKNATKKLAKKHSLIFQLYMIEGYDHEEISEIMGITASTSRSQLSRAKNNLKEILIQKSTQSNV
jgi:RNA polymerase sigma-70 factor (ECF subfamily)